jgi:hypothetical protein
MLPAAEKTTNREAVKRDFNDLDSLIQELNTPKEEIFKNQVNNSVAGTQQAPEAGISIPGATGEPADTETISDDVAALSGKTIAGTIDTVFSTGCSLYAKQPDSTKYEANAKQQDQLNNAWAAVAKKYGYKVEDSPWFNVALLSTAVYLPKLQEAKKDRRFAEMDEKIEALQKQINEKEARLTVVEKQTETKK